ncbi:uncharacterized protein CEXT_330131 [Caerostris extrusa]|uniref:Reverse transcriptase domain-containing protein n=1 Tax=Caerostris extrusa TaxID=172846 RepID=A0AAV4PQR6_CAEEX|nr:uncharacterized protein CEXT_330131 [Caerostris extrusa]
MRRRAQAQTEQELKTYWTSQHKKEKPTLKKMINKEKSNSWKKFCNEAKSPYGQIYKAAFNKFFQPPNLHSTKSNNSSVNNITNILTSLFQQDNYQQKEIRYLSTKIRTTPFLYNRNPSYLKNFTTLLKTMPKDKAPGPDGLDGRILTLFHKLDATEMLELYNKCKSMGSFPTSFKYREVVLFNKDPKIPSSYRPITLLPILGKCLEILVLK